MKRILHSVLNRILIIFFLLNNASLLYAQSHQWVKGGGASFAAPSGYTATEQVRETATDANGNVYVLAEILASGSITIDTITFPLYSGSAGQYRAKTALLSYTCDGHIRWGKIIESSNDVRFAGMTYSNGNIYISGAAAGSGAAIRYFGPDSVMAGNYHSSWLIKYDTSGGFKWMRSQGADNITSYGPTGNWFNKLYVQDTLIHCIKSIFGSGAQLSPTVTSQRGIYDYTYTPQGNLLSVVKLPLADSLLMVNIAVPGSLHAATNTLFVSVTNNVTYEGSGVASFDASRNLIAFDTFSTTGASFAGNSVSSFRAGNAIYSFGNYFGTNCTFKGQTYTYPFGSGGGRFGFVMKTDLSNNLIWKRPITAVGTSSGITTWSGALVNGKMALTGFAASVIVDGDTILLPGPTGKIPIVIMDSSGHVQKMDFWYNNNPTSGLESGMAVSGYNDNYYVGGTVSDSLWGGNSGYRSHGGQSDFFIAKYGYTCNCAAPTASFTHTAPASGLIGFTFTAPTAGLDSIHWQFGDGGTSNQFNPSHTFAAGTYNVCVTVYNSCGNTQACQSVTIACPQPAAAFTYTLSGTTVNTTYSGSTPVDSVRWTFAGGTPVSGSTATHTFAAAGSYSVCAIAYKECGRDTACQTITVSCPQPAAAFTYTLSNTTVNVTYSGSTPVDSVRWNFGSGPLVSGITASRNYGTAGTYTICAIAYRGCGRDTACQQVIISCPQPDAAFSYTTGGTTVNTTYSGSMATDSIHWNFGDGAAAAGTTASHTYAAPGTYNVCAVAFKGCGRDTACQQITLTCAPPDAAFSYQASGKTLQLQYLGLQPVTTVTWDFGDGATGTGNTTSHTYSATGLYNVCVTAQNTCSDSISCQPVQVQVVGISQPGLAAIKVYPNPAAHALIVENALPGTLLAIYDISGRQLQQLTVTQATERVDISGLAPGVYTLKALSGGQQGTWRFVKE